MYSLTSTLSKENLVDKEQIQNFARWPAIGTYIMF